MANVNGGTFDTWDTTAGATRAGKANVNTIVVSNPTGGALTVVLTSGGDEFLNVEVPATSVVTVPFAKPQVVQALTATIDSGAIVHVYYA